MKIYLIGMPGSGKTTLGRQVAAALRCRFVDLDDEIEKQASASIPEIFSRKGEDHFRRAESEMLRKWAESTDDFVMAAGGGAPCYHDGIGLMNRTGFSIFLDVGLNELLRRVRDQSHRPLLQETDAEGLSRKLESLQHSRRSCYMKAQVTISDPTTEMIIRAIRLKK